MDIYIFATSMYSVCLTWLCSIHVAGIQSSSLICLLINFIINSLLPNNNTKSQLIIIQWRTSYAGKHFKTCNFSFGLLWWHSIWYPKCQRDKLRRIQITAACLVTGSKGSNHITPLSKDLHCLSVEQRIDFKILFTTYKILHDQFAN